MPSTPTPTNFTLTPDEHPATADCSDPECLECGARDCPSGEPLHYHHDGCPACDM
jgi:hypothetical protein